MPLPAPTIADLRVKRGEPMDQAFFDRRSKLIVETLGAHRAEIEKQGAATDQLIALGLTRINEVLGPLLTSLNQAAELGFLIGVSGTSLTLTEGMEPTFEINEDTRSLFKPTPYLTISRSTEGAEDQFAIARLLEYDKDNGGLSVEIVAVENISGAHEDWVVSASAGLPLSVMAKLADITALAAQVASDRDAVEAALETVSTSVLSVAGKTGYIVLSIGDISGLLSALAGKAAVSHPHAASDITSGTIDPARLGTGTRDGSKFLRDDGQYAAPPGGGGAEWGGLTGSLSAQTDLVAALAAKADLDHSHAMSAITGLIDALAGKASTSHTQAISTITGLVDALAAKQAASANLDAWAGRTAPGSAVVGVSDAQTLTNKRVEPRVVDASAPTSFTWNSDNGDVDITGLATSLTIPADGGTPTNMRRVVIRIQDNGTQRTITWTTNAAKSFRPVGVTLPANTTAGKALYVGCMYNAAAQRWDVLSINQQA